MEVNPRWGSLWEAKKETRLCLPGTAGRQIHSANTMWALAMCVVVSKEQYQGTHRPLEFPGCLEGDHWETPDTGGLPLAEPAHSSVSGLC